MKHIKKVAPQNVKTASPANSTANQGDKSMELPPRNGLGCIPANVV